MPSLYLLYCRETDAGAALNLHGDGYRLNDGLYLIRSDLDRSPLYHRIKRQLGPDAPLLVAPLDGDPKFKGMNAGALKWLREG